MSIICKHNTFRYACEHCKTQSCIETVKQADSVEYISETVVRQTAGQTCNQCKSEDVYVRQYLNRSPDEGLTVVVTCKTCGYVSKQ